MTPSHSQPDEMRAAYFYFATPMTLQRAIFIALISCVILLPLNKLIRQYRPATLTFFEDNILIAGTNFSTQIFTKDIMTIYLSEKSKLNKRKKAKKQLSMRIEDIHLHTTNILLTNYSEAEAFVSWLPKYDKIKVEFSDSGFDFSLNSD